jgi:energy-coupling factor transport system ATP-binding protein
MDAPVLALDEPTVGLDLEITQRLMDIVSARHVQGTTVVMITHDLQWVARYAQRVAILYQGRLVAWGCVRQVLTDLEQLIAIGMEPLPVTTLASMLRWPPPLPLSADDVMARMTHE